jgi:hypothetical protein
MRTLAAVLAAAVLAATLVPAVALPGKPQTIAKAHKGGHAVAPTRKPASKAHRGG